MSSASELTGDDWMRLACLPHFMEGRVRTAPKTTCRLRRVQRIALVGIARHVNRRGIFTSDSKRPMA